MVRVVLTVAYDGSAYVGWQCQPNGISIQQRLEEAIEDLTGSFHRLHSSGRTDAGVHARAMICHCDTGSPLPLKAWREGLNSRLPVDIAVQDARLESFDFHARFSAKEKLYRYQILSALVRSPLERGQCWHVKKALDVDLMRVAALAFVGEHDFSSFRTTGCAAKTTVRNISQVDVRVAGQVIQVDVRGNGFLKNMVRMMVGTLVDIGLNKRPGADIEALLNRSGTVRPALTAPAHGLCLMKVFY